MKNHVSFLLKDSLGPEFMPIFVLEAALQKRNYRTAKAMAAASKLKCEVHLIRSDHHISEGISVRNRKFIQIEGKMDDLSLHHQQRPKEIRY